MTSHDSQRPLMDHREEVRAALDLFRAELPGFEALVDGEKDAIRIRGCIKLGAIYPSETFLVPVGDRNYAAKRVIDGIRQSAIELVGLQKVIDERIATAMRKARADGFAEGHSRGLADGRAALLRVWHDAIEKEAGR